MLLDLKSRLFGTQRSLCISSNFLFVDVILLYHITVLVDFLAMHVVQSLLRSGSMAKILRFDLRARLMARLGFRSFESESCFYICFFAFYVNLGLFVILSFSLYFESFKFTNTLIGLYLALYKMMPSTKEDALITFALLICFKQ